MKKQPKFSPEVIERAVRMVSEAGQPVRIAVGSHHVDCGQDRLYAGDVAALGTPARA